MLDIQRMKKDLDAMCIAIDDERLSLLSRYCELLLAANESVNLTAITAPREVELKHICDCLTLAALPEVTGSVADVGTGGGLPGVAIKIYKQDCSVCLIDATRKKLDFINEAAAALSLAVETVHARAEELGRTSRRESFDTAVARAVAALPALAEYCLPLVRVGGFFIAQKGAEDETESAKGIIAALGGRLERVDRITLPNGDSRSLVVVKKISQTPTGYPRKTAKILADTKKNRE